MNEKGYENTRFVVPAADIYENEEKYTILLDMPGTAKDTIEITTEGDILTVKAPVNIAEQEWKPVVTEFKLYDYKREFTIGNKVNRDSIAAKYENGILTVELTKAESAKPRKIEVKVA